MQGALIHYSVSSSVYKSRATTRCDSGCMARVCAECGGDGLQGV